MRNITKDGASNQDHRKATGVSMISSGTKHSNISARVHCIDKKTTATEYEGPIVLLVPRIDQCHQPIVQYETTHDLDSFTMHDKIHLGFGSSYDISCLFNP